MLQQQQKKGCTPPGRLKEEAFGYVKVAMKAIQST